jgi:hypothetical protein
MIEVAAVDRACEVIGELGDGRDVGIIEIEARGLGAERDWDDCYQAKTEADHASLSLMDAITLAESSSSATINAPIETVDIPAWCFTLPESEYNACSPAHYAAAATTAPDGRRMSINVEVLGGSLMVQHYVEDVAEQNHLRLVSTSDLFTPAGRTKIGVIWELRVRRTDNDSCELTNTVSGFATSELLEFLAKQGIPLDGFVAAQRPIVEAHNRQETPLFAKSIEAHAKRLTARTAHAGSAA